MKKKFFLALVSLFILFASFFSIERMVYASQGVSLDEEELVTVTFFDDRLCPVCAKAKDFASEIATNYPQVELTIYPINETEKLKRTASHHGIDDFRIMAPTVFVENHTTGEVNFFQFRDFTSRQESAFVRAINGEVVEGDCCMTTIPLLNIEVDIGEWSLPIIAMILGTIDGFNVCSIGALILILSIVMSFNSKKKIFFFGGLFIFTAVAVYGILVFLWGRAFEVLIGNLEILRVIVGLAALGGGVYFFKEFWRFFRYGPTCESSDSQIAKKATEKLMKAFQEPGQSTLYLAMAVASFAVIITLVELPCSVGVPLAFSAILVESGVSLTEHIFYILLFLFFYMLIELIIFTGAVLTKKIWFAGSKAITWVTFLGSMVLFYLAFYYLF